MQYCLDADIFIQAKNFYYHFDICPGSWDLLDQQIGTVGSIISVCEELESGNDKLKGWAKIRQFYHAQEFGGPFHPGFLIYTFIRIPINIFTPLEGCFQLPGSYFFAH